MTPPAHHFKDKTGLLTAVATEGFELFAAHLSASAAREADDPLAALHAAGRAYVEFSELYPGHFDVMFRPALIDTEDPAYAAASGQAFQLIRDRVAVCQEHGWRREADGSALTAAVWALVHGLSVLRRQGSLGRHFHDPSPGVLRRRCDIWSRSP
jgi:AcrR family transcriptional regulator